MEVKQNYLLSALFSFTILFASPIQAADSLLVFKTGDTARATDINSNFKFLLEKWNFIVQENQILKKTIDSLKGAKQTPVNVDSLNLKFGGLNSQVVSLNSRIDSISLKYSQKFDSANLKSSSTSTTLSSISSKTDSLSTRTTAIENKLVVFPKGSIVASMIEPGADGYLPNTDNTWILAAGQGSINSVTIPDLRGIFLRGIDYALTGRALTGRDSTSSRIVGSEQGDQFASHRHEFGHGPEAYVQAVSSSGVLGLSASSPSGSKETTSYVGGGNETRPKNVAVYYYIKVK